MRIALSVLIAVFVLGAPGASAQSGFKGNEVKLCVDENFRGECHSFFLEPGMRHRLVPTLPPSIDNKISSIWAGVGVYAYMFRHPHFRGASSFFSYHPSLHGRPTMKTCGSQLEGKSWNDDISSLIITRFDARCHVIDDMGPLGVVEGAYLASDLVSNGECPEAYYPLPEAAAKGESQYPNLGSTMNDRAEKVYLCGIVEVELYPEPHFKGTPLVIQGGETADSALHSLAAFGMEHEVSSLIIRSRSGKVEAGQAPPQQPPRGAELAGKPHPAPPARPQPAIASGPLTVPSPDSIAFEPDIDRPGHDYTNFDLPEPRPEICRDACRNDGRCRAFTYVSPGIQGSQARCWLKDGSSEPRAAKGMVSGVK